MLNAHKQDASAVTSICTNRTKQKRKRSKKTERNRGKEKLCITVGSATGVRLSLYGVYTGCVRRGDYAGV